MRLRHAFSVVVLASLLATIDADAVTRRVANALQARDEGPAATTAGEGIRLEALQDPLVVGRVHDRDKNPVKGADVTYTGPRKGKVVTDGAGGFRFSGPAGMYELIVKSGARSQKFIRTVANPPRDVLVLTVDW